MRRAHRSEKEWRSRRNEVGEQRRGGDNESSSVGVESAPAHPPSHARRPAARVQFARGRMDKRSIGEMIRRLRRLRANAAARSIQRRVRQQQMRHREQQQLLRANEDYFENMRWKLQVGSFDPLAHSRHSRSCSARARTSLRSCTYVPLAQQLSAAALSLVSRTAPHTHMLSHRTRRRA